MKFIWSFWFQTRCSPGITYASTTFIFQVFLYLKKYFRWTFHSLKRGITKFWTWTLNLRHFINFFIDQSNCGSCYNDTYRDKNPLWIFCFKYVVVFEPPTPVVHSFSKFFYIWKNSNTCPKCIYKQKKKFRWIFHFWKKEITKFELQLWTSAISIIFLSIKVILVPAIMILIEIEIHLNFLF